MGDKIRRYGGILVRWLDVWGTIGITVVFASLSILVQVGFGSILSGAWAVVTMPVFITTGLLSALLNPVQRLRFDRAMRGADARRHTEGLCQHLLMTVSESCRSVPVTELAVHAWRKDGKSLRRLASFRVARRQDAAVEWEKGKGAVGRCWETNMELVADLTDLNAAAAEGQAAFEQIPSDGRFGLTWSDYQHTSRYWSISVTPLRDERGRFIGCLSIDCTSQGHHKEFIAACTSRPAESLASLIEEAVRRI